MQVEKVKAVKADVLERYYRYICRKIQECSQAKNNTGKCYTSYKKAKRIQSAIKARVEYNRQYLEKGMNPVMFVERF